jgi:biopolymer transport protein ExbD
MALLIRRTSNEPRLELMPLLDVIFLLLTFFIYSQAIMIRAHVLPVKLPMLSTGQPAEVKRIVGITVNSAGHVFLDQQRVPLAALGPQLAGLAKEADPPRVFLAIEDKPGNVDRGPMLVKLMEMIRAAGIDQFSLVGSPSPPPPSKGEGGE